MRLDKIIHYKKHNNLSYYDFIQLLPLDQPQLFEKSLKDNSVYGTFVKLCVCNIVNEINYDDDFFTINRISKYINANYNEYYNI